MNRLIHSSSALLRALQMSAAQVFVFVEGKTDVYFYSKICKAVCDSLAVSYEIHSLQQLGGSGGKLGLLALHDQLEQNKSLVDTRFGKTTVCLFYLDKDTESSRKLRRSRHIAYTLYYTLENHIFLEANVTEAIRIAASLDTSYTLPSSKDLCRLASVHWKEWGKLCLLAYTKGIGSDCGYHSNSRINTEPNGSISQTEYTKYQGILQSRGELSQNDFD
ncbi:MAG: hypothetical protein NT023_06180, partial [Armatimonadetes bacterium]|nr:hypothetical protein [Armatimonadota bacterium]